jgi:hypothetical protein
MMTSAAAARGAAACRQSVDWLLGNELPEKVKEEEEEVTGCFFRAVNDVRCALLAPALGLLYSSVSSDITADGGEPNDVCCNTSVLPQCVDLLQQLSSALRQNFPQQGQGLASSVRIQNGKLPARENLTQPTSTLSVTTIDGHVGQVSGERGVCDDFTHFDLVNHCAEGLDVCIGILELIGDKAKSSGVKSHAATKVKVKQLHDLCSSQSYDFRRLWNTKLKPLIGNSALTSLSFALFVIQLFCDYTNQWSLSSLVNGVLPASPAMTQFHGNKDRKNNSAMQLHDCLRAEVAEAVDRLLTRQFHYNLGNDVAADMLMETLANRLSGAICCFVFDDLLETGTALPNVCICGRYEATLHKRRKNCIVFYNVNVIDNVDNSPGLVCQTMVQLAFDDCGKLGLKSASEACRQLRLALGELGMDTWGMASVTCRARPGLSYNCRKSSVFLRQSDGLFSFVLVSGFKANWTLSRDGFYFDQS